MKRILTLAVMIAMVLGFSMQAQATLQNLGVDNAGNKLIYDTDLDITWYDYSAYGSWQNQVDWADALSVTTAANTYTDWRLPITFSQGCSGYNCTNSEMGHLYYTELGNVAGVGGFTNTGDFENLQSSSYWSGTEYSANTVRAWGFQFPYGSQSYFTKATPFYAMAVRPGLAVVPEPISSTLFLAGAATLGFRRFRKKNNLKLQLITSIKEKKMKRILTLSVMMVMVFVFSMQAQATLQNLSVDSLGNKLIYDTDQDITWYDFTTPTLETWQTQVDWADALSLTFEGITFDDWRLPIVTDIGNDGCNYSYNGTDCGYNVDPSTGEMAHLFNELGNLAYYDTSGSGPQPGWGLINTGDFVNLQAGGYWTGTEYSAYTPYAWYYNLNYDNQEHQSKVSPHIYRGIAVMSGKAVGAVVPEPISSTLFIVGAATLGFRRFRKKSI